MIARAATTDCELVAVRVADLNALIGRATARWLTVDGAALHSSLSAESIRRLLAAGELTAHRPRKGRVLIDRLELDQLIANSTVTPRKGRGRSPGSRGGSPN